jgi:hypothetical protein
VHARAHRERETHTHGRKTCGSNSSEVLYIVTLCSKCSRALTLRMLSQRMEDLVSGKAAEHKNDAGPLRELADGIKAITSADSAHRSVLPVSQSAAGAWHPRFDGLSLPPSLSFSLSLPRSSHTPASRAIQDMMGLEKMCIFVCMRAGERAGMRAGGRAGRDLPCWHHSLLLSLPHAPLLRRRQGSSRSVVRHRHTPYRYRTGGCQQGGGGSPSPASGPGARHGVVQGLD